MDMSEQSSEPHLIRLPDGDTLELRKDFAEDTLHVCDKTAKRMNLPTTYVGGKAYVARNASLAIVAATVKRANQPQSTSSRHVSKRKATRPQRRARS
jgi:hypothetical protein